MIHDILDSISDGLDAILQWIVGGKHAYKGKLGNSRKVLKYKHRKGNGIRIGEKFISMKQSLHGGLLLIGKTGIGKTSKIFAQQLFGASKMVDTSFVVFDQTKQARDMAMPYMEQELGYDEDIINFADATQSTVGWNPIENLPLDRINRFSEELVAIEGGTNVKEPIWNNTASAIIGMMIWLLKYIQAELGTNRYTNLYNVRYLVTLIQANVKKMNVLVAKYGDDMLYTSYRGLIKNDAKFLNSALSNTLSVLKNWQDENVIKTTARTTLDMGSYRDEKRILWIQSSVMAQDYLKGLNSLFLKEWFTQIIEAGIPTKTDNVIAFLVDEAGSLKTKNKQFIPFISSQIRKYKAYGIWGYQSFSQCQDLYTQQGAETLKANTGSVLYLGGTNLATATEISKSLGKYSYKENDRTHHREVLTPQEVMHKNTKDGGIFISSGQAPMLLKRIKAYYQNKKYRKWAEEQAPPIQSGIDAMPPLLPVDVLIGKANPNTPGNG